MAKLIQYVLKSGVAMLFVFLVPEANAQQPCRLIIYPVDTDSAAIASLQLQNIFSNKASCLQYTDRLPQLLAMKGYAAASVDSAYDDSTSVSIRLFVGNKFIWEKLSVNDSAYSLLNKLGYYQQQFDHQNFLQQNLERLYNDVLDYYGRNGYPFATVFLDSIAVNANKISAHLDIQSGPLYHIDTVIVEGTVKISRFFLQQYLQIHDHDIYDTYQLDDINRRLSELNFLQQSQPWQIEMLNTGARLHLYLQSTRSNSVNVLIGLLPQNDQTNGKLLFTGEATVGLRNSFGGGETLGLNWQQLQPKSPQLNLLYQQPYIFRSAFGMNLNFQLQKQDSLFLNIGGQVSLQYELGKQQSGALIIQTSSTNVLSVDTNLVKATGMLPAIADVNSTSIGLQYNFYNTDYRFNPRRGNEVFVSGILGKQNH
jgi:outer membrane protein assembly factor BamA